MSIQQLLLGAAGASGYNLQRSVRLRQSASGYLNRTPSVAGSRTTWTWSGWVKIGVISSNDNALFMALNNASGAYNVNDWSGVFLRANATFDFIVGNGGSVSGRIITTQVFRDFSSWYHLVFTYDSTNATSTDRMRMYVNGARVTAFSTATYPSINTNSYQNTTNSQFIGQSWLSGAPSNPFDGYLAEVNFIDGQALTPASFGSTNALTGVWQPAPYTGTYGTNGFYLKFTDNSTAAALGTDFSGNSNTWTVNNISVTAGVTYDSMTDVPTLTSATAANYCTINPISGAFTSTTFSAGNLDMTVSGGVFNKGVAGTIAIPRTGKWYFELTLNSGAGTPGGIGVGFGAVSGKLYGDSADLTSLAWATDSAGNIYANSASIATATTWNTNGKLCACTIDYTNNEIKFYVDNVLSYTLSGANFPTVDVMPLVHNGARGVSLNFGQRPFAYTPPTGFVALNTFNLAASTIVKGNTVMDATIWSGDGTSPKAQTNAAGFQPDLVWIKNRSVAYSHNLFDSVRGSGTARSLQSDNTNSEATNASNTALYGYLSAFNSNGFSTTNGTDPTSSSIWVNASGQTYVGWNWKAGGAAVTNTSGSISAQVSANPTAGFSVVTYTGTGANATVGHGLGVAPKMIIVKQRNGTFTWRVYHASLANTQVLFLSATDAATTETTAWNSTTPASSVFSVGTSNGTNGSTNTYVAYCWSEIDGFSKFGSYTGNGSTDGPFVYTGFRPKFILRKGTISAGINWSIIDSSRNTYNLANANLFPNTSGAESVPSGEVDITSNGFKVRSTSFNNSGEVYIYACYAENPFKNALAR
jgi:hypothetical protein